VGRVGLVGNELVPLEPLIGVPGRRYAAEGKETNQGSFRLTTRKDAALSEDISTEELSFVHAFVHDESHAVMRQQQPEHVLTNQLRELAPKHHITTALPSSGWAATVSSENASASTPDPHSFDHELPSRSTNHTLPSVGSMIASLKAIGPNPPALSHSISR